jgi:hypothetical protein
MKDLQVKRIIWNEKETQYFLFSNGDLYNANTHRISQGTINNNYLRYTINIEGKDIGIYKHQLLAQFFIPNPENKPFVNHINGCTQDNNLENLEWVTQQENCNKKVNPPQKKPEVIFTQEELDNEIWKPFRKTHYEISNLGRAKNLITGRIAMGSINKNSGYLRFTYTDEDGKRNEMQMHRAVYEAFHPDEKIDVINHIDSNRSNNKLSNLENISQSENVIKSYYDTKTKKTFITGQYDLNMNLINVYPSQSAAAQAINLKYPTNIRQAVNTGQQSHGYYWRRLSVEEYNEFLKNKES